MNSTFVGNYYLKKKVNTHIPSLRFTNFNHFATFDFFLCAFLKKFFPTLSCLAYLCLNSSLCDIYAISALILFGSPDISYVLNVSLENGTLLC